MKINVSRVAKLANLSITETEEKKFETQLGSILDYVAKLQEADTKNVEPTSQVTGLENVTREDIAFPSLSQEDVLSSTKELHKEHFKVKAILDNE